MNPGSIPLAKYRKTPPQRLGQIRRARVKHYQFFIPTLSKLPSNMVLPAEQRPPPRKPKKSYIRSRTGCLTCRQRHQKCDEQRPICGNCMDISRQCEYPLPVLPLRERRKANLPGEQQPWNPANGLTTMTMSRAVGPCLSRTTRPITMAFKSNELFHYFYELEDPCDVAPKERRQDLLASVMQSADALRNTMLIAGLHYAWNAGHLMSFEPTLLFHKIEAMNLINEFLQESGPKYGVCVRHIATLSFMECALGNITAAETHLNGLMRFMDVHRPPHLLNQTEFDLDDELSNRYIILSYNFIHGFKSRLYDILEQNDLHKPHQRPSPSQVEELMHGWHKTEMHGLDIRLKALKMLPFFFTELPPTTRFVDIDVTSMVDCLINLTATARLRSQSVDPHDQQVIWQEGAATRLMLGFVGLHIESISGGDNTRWSTRSRTRLTSSWSGMATAAGLYLHVILQFWNAGEPIPTQLHRRILYILKQDLDRSRHWLGSGSRVTSDLWFWKAFIGAMSLERGVTFDTQGILGPLRRPYKKFLQEWSVVIGVTMWDEAKEALAKIVWPEPFSLAHLAENLWYRSIA